MKTAVIVTTYNRPDALAAVLAGYAAQRNAAFELIIADDGSTASTRSLVDDFKSRTDIPVTHVWHEDNGFRAAAIRNRALAATQSDYLIFSDGDCIPSPHFVATHQHLAERGWFVAGNRVLLSESFTARALEKQLPLHAWGIAEWLRGWLRGDVNRCLPLLRMPVGAVRKATPSRWKGVKTCNMAVWRDDLLRVNGLDETYSGWGLEDSDLAVRLIRAGIRHKSARLAAPVFHLWHVENDRSKLPENQHRLDSVITSQAVRAQMGLDQYS
jgi:glycosyltransferase involved in cell wall biosynthesis